MATRNIVCILLDFFIISIELQNRDNLTGKPVIVGGDPKRRGLIVAASPEAMVYGIRPGMPTWEALRSCPQATLLEAHPDIYHDTAQLALGVLTLYSDRIEHSQLDCFYMDAPSNGVEEIMAGMQQQLASQVHLSASVGIAANKLVAHIAAGLHAPGGLVRVAAKDEASFLAPLNLEWLVNDDDRNDGKTLMQLKRLGVHTIGDLARVPEHMLTPHLGEAGKALLRHAQGKDARQIHAAQQLEVEWEQVFERAIDNRDALRRWVIYLSSRVGQGLRAQGYRARTLTLTLGHIDGSPTVISTVLAKPSDLDQTLRDLALGLLAAWDERNGIVSMGIEAGIFADEPSFQLLLFDTRKDTGDSSDPKGVKDSQREEEQHRLDHTKNGLNRRYGPGTVMAAMLLDDEILAAIGKRRKK